MWVDTHCHLQLDDQSSESLLQQAKEVNWVVVPGIDLPSSQTALDLSLRFPDQVKVAAGIHPHESQQWATQYQEIEQLFSQVSAVGETGLDYYREHSPRSVQRMVYKLHARAALALNKPLITHCRDAFADLYELISLLGVGELTVMHCWTGGPRWTKRFLELGVTFSFAGPITYPTADAIRKGAALVPPDRAMVETDTPYLAPVPHRGQPNQPAWVRYNGQALASIWGLPEEEVARLTTRQATRVFGH